MKPPTQEIYDAYVSYFPHSQFILKRANLDPSIVASFSTFQHLNVFVSDSITNLVN